MALKLTAAQIDALQNPTMATAKTVSAATNASPAVLTTSAAHGYSVGDMVLAMGQATNTNVNGLFRVGTTPTTTTLTLTDSAGAAVNGNGATGTGTIQKITSGCLRNLKPYDLRNLMASLKAISTLFTSDADAGAAESDLGTIFPAGGPNP